MTQERYKELAKQEANHWGAVSPDAKNPQLWHDERLFEIFFGKEYRHFIERIAAAGPNVLELGCGEGHLAVDLAQRGLQVTALDLSPERIERARNQASTLGVHKPIFQVADLNTAELPRSTFNCVVAHDALHHLYNLDHVLDETAKALKPGGRLMTIDYIGMKRIRKLGAAFLYAILPTHQPYRYKWQLRHRLKAFFASESSKRDAIASGKRETLHQDSPFEEISQESIIQKIRDRFEIVELFTFSPFWFYLAPKIRTPRAARYPVATLMKSMDDLLLNVGVRGAYVFVEARTRP